MNYTRLILEACKNSLKQSGDSFFGDTAIDSNGKFNEKELKKIVEVFSVFVSDFLDEFKEKHFEAGTQQSVSKRILDKTNNSIEKLNGEITKVANNFFNNVNLETLADYFDKFLEIWNIPCDFDDVFEEVFQNTFHKNVSNKIKEFAHCYMTDDVFDKVKEKAKEFRAGEFNFEM